MNVAVVMSYIGRSEQWLLDAIACLKSANNIVDIYIYINNNNVILSSVLPSNVYIVGQSDNVGPGQAANLCFMRLLSAEKKYDYIARMDDDDLCDINRIDEQVAFLENHSDIDFCGTMSNIIDENGSIIVADWTYAADSEIDIVDRYLIGGNYIVHASCMFRGNMLYDKGHLWYNPLYFSGEDYDLWFRLFKLGYKYKLLNKRLYSYRMHKLQVSKNIKQENRAKVHSALHAFYRNNWGFLC